MKIPNCSATVYDDFFPMFEGKLELLNSDGDKKEFTVPANISILFAPAPQVALRLAPVGHVHAFATTLCQKSGVTKVRTPGSLIEFQIITRKWREIGDSVVSMATPEKYPLTIKDTGKPLKSVDFSLVNCLNLGNISAIFTVERWKIEIVPSKDFKRIDETLYLKGGCGITHHGKLLRSDNLAFTSEQAETQLNVLQLFLSFARGGGCGIGYAIGRDQTGNDAWIHLGSLLMHNWKPAHSWLNHQHNNNEFLITAFTGFWQKFKDRLLPIYEERPVILALYWYLDANQSSSSYTSVVLAQIALERLSSIILTGDEWNNNKKLLGKLTATLQKCRVSLDVPQELAELSASNKNKHSAPKLLISIRNQLVHSEPNQKFKYFSKDWIQARELSLWYVELLLLWIFKYEGRYSNRIILNYVGENDLETVPWALDKT